MTVWSASWLVARGRFLLAREVLDDYVTLFQVYEDVINPDKLGAIADWERRLAARHRRLAIDKREHLMTAQLTTWAWHPDATEFSWQRAKYRGARHVLAPADAGLVGANTLQHWLWQRLRRPTPDGVDT